MTKPDPKLAAPKRGKMPMHGSSIGLEECNKQARKILGAAMRKAARTAQDAEQSRSTRTRAALKIRSDAVPEALRALEGGD